MANSTSTFDPISTKPKEAPKKVNPVGGAMGYFDGETESESPLSNSIPDTFYEAFKDAPFNLFDPSRPAETTQPTEAFSGFMGSIDFVEHNRMAQESQRLTELQAEIQNSGLVSTQDVQNELKETPQVFSESTIPNTQEKQRINLSETLGIKDYIKFGEFFKILGGESKLMAKSVKNLFIENILPPKKNPRAEKMEKMSPEQVKTEEHKQKVKRTQGSFYSILKDITRGMSIDMARMLEGRRKNINQQVGLNENFSGSIDKQTGEVRFDIQILAEKKNSEMKASEIKAKKQQQMAAVTGGGKNLRTHMGAQEGQSMVANAVLTAG